MARMSLKRNLKRTLKRTLKTRWARTALVVAGVLVLLLVFRALAKDDLVVWSTLRKLDDDPVVAEREIRALGRPYQDSLGRALRGGSRRFKDQLFLSEILLTDPFYARGLIKEALGSEDPLVSRAAATAFLRLDRAPEPGRVPDDVFAILEDWVDEPADARLGMALAALTGYRDDRLAPLLVAVLRSAPSGLDEYGRAKLDHNRSTAARLLVFYVEEPGVVDCLKEIVSREKEGKQVQHRAWKALASSGYRAEPELYWKAARSGDPLVRQVVASSLQFVEGEEIVPILLALLADRDKVVRRNAIEALWRKRVPVLMDEIHYLAEDSFGSLKGDLAQAVGDFRRKDLVPFVAWCLLDHDPVVVEKAIGELNRMTGRHHGFDAAQWGRYENANVLARINMMKEFINDEDRRKAAAKAWKEDFPPGYGDEDRVAPLIRQLAHVDPDNVERAMRQLARITGRKEGFPPEVLDASAPDGAKVLAVDRFMREDRDKVIADWKAWSK